MAEELDIISTLPDAIICHILSFLETKHAVATSVLSTRWKHLYLSVPVLYFDTTVVNQNAFLCLNDFLYSLLLSRDPSLPINTFHLKFTYYEHEHEIHYSPLDPISKWVKSAAQRGLQYLDLKVNHLNALDFTKLSINILNYNKTLVVLKIHNFIMEEISSPVDLPSLKTLDLDKILFPKIQDFIMLLTGCPILENLYAFNVWFDSAESVTRDEWKSFCLTNLTLAELYCSYVHFPLKAFRNVASLRLIIDQVNCRDDDFIPTFRNLTQLELADPNYSWRFILELFKHCPKLQKLKINQDGLIKETSKTKDDRKNWADPDFVPQCLLLHLRTCNLVHFLGLQGELLLAKYILKNARVLQTMRISNVGQTNIKRLISSYPRASATSKVTIDQCFKKRGRK